MRILMLAWRDLKHPKKGGAEIVTDKYLSGLSKLGHNVVLFSSAFKGCKKKEEYNGYTIIRKGGSLSVYFYGLKFALRNKFDVTIDQINTIPFFTPLFIKNSVAFVHQLCLNVWFWESWFPVGYLFELLYLKLYHNHKAFVVSESTKKDLVKYAWMKPKNILVLENQIDFAPRNKINKKERTFCFCGRLKKSKRAQDCIYAIKHVNAKLFIIGDGDYRKNLEQLVKKLGLREKVVFFGRVSFEKRNELMSKCLAILVSSVREGWGLIVTEANANGTMAITYDVPGLIDSNKTGIIVKKDLVKAMRWVLRNPEKVADMSKKSLIHARGYCDWEKNILKLDKWLSENL